jgi:hypothetical protein
VENNKNLRLVIFLVMAGILVFIPEMKAQKKGHKKGSKSSKSAPKGSANGPNFLILGEVSVGVMGLINRGPYLDYQKQYYLTDNPDFSITGNFPTQISPTANAGIFVYPFFNVHNFLKHFSGGVAFSWSMRKMRHDVDFTNKSFPQQNRISISDFYSAHYLGTDFQIRYGRQLYFLAGVRSEYLLSGVRKRNLHIVSDSITGGKPLDQNDEWNLKGSEIIRKNNPGWHLAVGYTPLPRLGIRVGSYYSSGFFSNGLDITCIQPYLAVFIPVGK